MTIQWGFEVTRIEIKDIRLPATLCRKMAAEEEALREAAAKLIAAKGELQVNVIFSLQLRQQLCDENGSNDGGLIKVYSIIY